MVDDSEDSDYKESAGKQLFDQTHASGFSWMYLVPLPFLQFHFLVVLESHTSSSLPDAY